MYTFMILLHAALNKQCIEQTTNMFGVEDDSFVCIPSVQTQNSTTDCGLFVIANMTVLVNGKDPSVM